MACLTKAYKGLPDQGTCRGEFYRRETLLEGTEGSFYVDGLGCGGGS